MGDSGLKKGLSDEFDFAKPPEPAGLKFGRWFKPTLQPGEKIESTFDFGWWKIDLYTVFATNKRLIIVKRFPKNLLEITYNQIELMEYYTDVEWLKGVYSFFGFMIMFMYMFNRELIMKTVYSLAPFVERLFNAFSVMGLPAGEFLTFLALLSVSVFFCGFFVLSFFGKLKISLYDQAPFDITTELAPEIQELIMLVNQKKEEVARQKRQV